MKEAHLGNMNLKTGQHIQMKSERDIRWFFRTRKWMAGLSGTIANLNNKTVTIVFDDYPEEKHYVDYGDFDVV